MSDQHVVDVLFDQEPAARMWLPSPTDHIQQQIRERQRFYEERFLKQCARYISPGSMVIDVGANIGNHTIFYASICNARVTAIEPGPDAREILEKNLRLNGLADKVACLPWAATSKPNRGELETFQDNLGKSRFIEASEGGITGVPIDDMEIAGPVSLLKCDVEGMELECLKGARKTLKESGAVVAVECAREQDLYAVITFMGELGYLQGGVFNATPTYFFHPNWKPETQTRILQEHTAAIKATLSL
jgi:FkbM family methyltransferase